MILFLSACSPLFKDRTTEDLPCNHSSSEEIKKVYSSMESIQAIDVALHISKNDLSSLVNKSFRNFLTKFSELDAREFSNLSFGQFHLDLDAQQVMSKLAFTFQVDGLKRKIYGHVRAKHSIRVGRDQFVLSANFDEVIIDRIDDNNDLDNSEESRHLVSSSVKSLMHALNMEIRNSPLIIPIDLNILKDINGKDIFSSPDYRLHSAKPVNIFTKMKAYVPYIYDGGVVLFGSSTLEVSDKSVKYESTCFWRELNHIIDLELIKSMDISLAELQQKTSYYISKSYLSKKMNTSLKNTDLRSIKKSFLQIRDDDKTFSKDIYFSDEYALPSCEKARRDCSKTLQRCQRECTVAYGVHKCENCAIVKNPFERERCITKQESCKTREELNLYECTKNVAKCQHENNEIRKACEVENISLFSQCSEKKEKLLLVNDEIKMARLRLGLEIVNSYIVQRIGTINFNRDMDELETFRDLHISMDTRLNVDVKNTMDSDINCTIKIEAPLFTHSQSDHMGLKRKFSLVTQTLPDGHMMIKGTSKPYLMKVQLNNTPYENFISNDGLVLQCNLMNVPILSLTKETFLKQRDIPDELSAVVGKVGLKFEVEELIFLISPVKLSSDILLYPRMRSKSIGFSR